MAPRHPPRALCSLTSLSSSPNVSGAKGCPGSSPCHSRQKLKIFNCRSHLHLVRFRACAPGRLTGPLPAIRWSLAPSSLAGDQGSDDPCLVGRHRTTARRFRAVVSTGLSLRGRGVYPIFSSVVVRCARYVRPRMCGASGGGDEETRTPDPLLAKEMLFQLSYVPAVRP